MQSFRHKNRVFLANTTYYYCILITIRTFFNFIFVGSDFFVLVPVANIIFVSLLAVESLFFVPCAFFFQRRGMINIGMGVLMENHLGLSRTYSSDAQKGNISPNHRSKIRKCNDIFCVL